MTRKLAYSPKEAAEALSMSRSTLYRLIDEGSLRIVKLGQKTLIPVTEICALLGITPADLGLTAETRPVAALPPPAVDLQKELFQHEVLHTASVLFDSWDRQVLAHEITQGDRELRGAAQKAFNAMHDFYSLCGRKFLG